jgi:hypothetical protein
VRRGLLLIALFLTACGAPPTIGLRPDNGGHKVFVCKYVGTPGVDERLQTGDNPISVDESAIPIGPPVKVGDEFADAQGRSIVIAFDNGQPEPDVSDCPAPEGPPPPPSTTTTTVKSTTTTQASTTTAASTTIPSSTTTSSTVPATTTTSSTAPSTTTTTAPGATTTTTSPGTTTTTTAPGPILRVNFLTPICDGDVPYLSYSASFGSATVVQHITFINPNGPDVSYFNLPLSGRVLWPGAVVDAAGEPLDWPGWTQLPDGTWVEGDEFDWVRPSVTVELEINPTATAVVAYPPSTPQCATNPPANPPAPGAPPAAPPGGLPPTV